MRLNGIQNLDCVRGLQKMPAESVDLAFADPPFNIGYDYDIYDDRRESDEYLRWSRQWISAVIRVLKPTGTFWLAIGDEYAAELKVLCTRELALHCRSWVIWFYTFGVHCKQKFTRSHAHLFHFVKDREAFTFNSLDIRVPSARELVYGDKRADPDGRVPDDTWMMAPVLPPEVATKDSFILRPQDIPERFPPNSDTWYFSRVAGTFGERRGWHGCQMPEQLLGRIIKACSREDDLVLDPFGGSGTTLAVAKKLKRRFVGFELSADYARRIEERLASVKPGEPLVGPENAALSAPRTKAGRKLDREKVLPVDSNLRSKMVAEFSPALKGPPVSNPQFSVAHSAITDKDIRRAIVEAFRTAHQGYSSDRVLADPSLNDRFLDNCRTLSIPGSAKDWNHLLLDARKRGVLAAVATSRRTVVPHAQMDAFMFASEMAWKRVSTENDCTLDDIFCDPDLASRFESLARRIAPGHSAFDYRWAAFALRKMASDGRPILDEISGELSRRSVRLADIGRLAEGPGHYLITVGQSRFFVGFSEILRTCPLFKPDCLLTALDIAGKRIASEKDVEIRTRAFEPAGLRTMSLKQVDAHQVRAARRAKLLLKFEPIANVPLPPGKRIARRVAC